MSKPTDIILATTDDLLAADFALGVLRKSYGQGGTVTYSVGQDGDRHAIRMHSHFRVKAAEKADAKTQALAILASYRAMMEVAPGAIISPLRLTQPGGPPPLEFRKHPEGHWITSPADTAWLDEKGYPADIGNLEDLPPGFNADTSIPDVIETAHDNGRTTIFHSDPLDDPEPARPKPIPPLRPPDWANPRPEVPEPVGSL